MLVSESAHVSAWSAAPESTGLVPDRSLAPAPLAVNVKSDTFFVPPLSFVTTLRRWSFGALSLFVIEQTAVSPRPSWIEAPSTACPPFFTHDHAVGVYPAGPADSDRLYVP